jgi:hypothetical protein
MHRRVKTMTRMNMLALVIAAAAALSGVAPSPAAALPFDEDYSDGHGGGCPDWACSTNGTKLTGIALPSVASRRPVVTAVKLPSGETVHLHR